MLVEKGFVNSIDQARRWILAGQVLVKNLPILLKPGTLCDIRSVIEIQSLPRYVSRGGEKLESALLHWNMDLQNKVCLDVGTSTGGFTDCLLQQGAQHVYAVDVGQGQFHPKLRKDNRVHLFEKSHILKWNPPWKKDLKNEPPQLLVADLSFISLRSVLPRFKEIMPEKSKYLLLIKPQFEVEEKWLEKGILRNELERKKSIESVLKIAKDLGFSGIGHFPCPLRGRKGNVEEWLYLQDSSEAVN